MVSDELHKMQQNSDKLQKDLEREAEAKARKIREMEADAERQHQDALREQQILKEEMERQVNIIYFLFTLWKL